MRYLPRVSLVVICILIAVPTAHAHFTLTSPQVGSGYPAGSAVDVAIAITVHHNPGGEL